MPFKFWVDKNVLVSLWYFFFTYIFLNTLGWEGHFFLIWDAKYPNPSLTVVYTVQPTTIHTGRTMNEGCKNAVKRILKSPVRPCAVFRGARCRNCTRPIRRCRRRLQGSRRRGVPARVEHAASTMIIISFGIHVWRSVRDDKRVT